MATLLAHLSATARVRLLREINYLNLSELHGFCRDHDIPFRILREEDDGRLVSTGDNDRKAIVLARVARYLGSGRRQRPTVYRRSVIATADPPATFQPRHRLLYGWYDKHNPAFLEAMKKLTGGTFRSGAVARILIAGLWAKGEAPTLREFAEAWLRANERGLEIDKGKHPEAAFLTDRARGEGGADWKEKRRRIARRVQQVLRGVRRPH